MTRRIFMLAVATCLAAAAAPAAASASPVLTSATNPGEPMPVGSDFVGTSTNVMFTGTLFGALTCEHYVLYGEVTENTGSGIAGVGTGGETAGCLAQPGNRTFTVTDPTLVELRTTESGKATVEITLTYDIGPFECHFTGSGAATYATDSNLIHFNIILQATSPLCESEEPGELGFSGNFKLTEEGGAPVLIS